MRWWYARLNRMRLPTHVNNELHIHQTHDCVSDVEFSSTEKSNPTEKRWQIIYVVVVRGLFKRHLQRSTIHSIRIVFFDEKKKEREKTKKMMMMME